MLAFIILDNSIVAYQNEVQDGSVFAESNIIYSTSSRLYFFRTMTGYETTRPASQFYCAQVSAELDGPHVKV
jgi:hypothetical protein